MSVCMTKSNKFEHLEITEIFLSFDKIGKFGTLKDTITGFKLEAKKPVKKVDCSHGSRTSFGVLFTRAQYPAALYNFAPKQAYIVAHIFKHWRVLSSNLSNSGSSTNINREREYCQTARK